MWNIERVCQRLQVENGLDCCNRYVELTEPRPGRRETKKSGEISGRLIQRTRSENNVRSILSIDQVCSLGLFNETFKSCKLFASSDTLYDDPERRRCGRISNNVPPKEVKDSIRRKICDRNPEHESFNLSAEELVKVCVDCPAGSRIVVHRRIGRDWLDRTGIAIAVIVIVIISVAVVFKASKLKIFYIRVLLSLIEWDSDETEHIQHGRRRGGARGGQGDVVRFARVTYNLNEAAIRIRIS